MLLEAALADFSEQRKWTDGNNDRDGGATSSKSFTGTSLKTDRSSSDEKSQQRKLNTIKKKQQERGAYSALKGPQRRDHHRARSRRTKSMDSSTTSSRSSSRSSRTTSGASSDVEDRHRGTVDHRESDSVPRGGSRSRSSAASSAIEATLDVISLDRSSDGTSSTSSSIMSSDNATKDDEEAMESSPGRSGSSESGSSISSGKSSGGNGDGETSRERRPLDSSTYGAEHGAKFDEPRHVPVAANGVKRGGGSLISERRQNAAARLRRTNLEEAVGVHSQQQPQQHLRDGSSSGSSSDRGLERKSDGMPFGEDSGHAPAVSIRTAFSQRRAFLEWRGNHDRADADPDASSVHSDDASHSSPVSTLDLPFSSPNSSTAYSPLTQDAPGGVRHGGRLEGGGTAVRGTPGASVPGSQPHHRSINSAFISVGEMTDELPSVMEEDEEDLESGSGFHTIEFEAMESPVEGREDWSLSGKTHSAKSMSAPHSRQGSLLHPAGPANRGRRRSDFDWPEDFDERPEEVVKEVDDSLWAFSPVASTFVFSGNEASPSVRPELHHLTSSPGSSPGMVEHMTLKRNFVKSAFSTKHNHGLRSSMDPTMTFGELPTRRKSSNFQHYVINGEDRYFGGAMPPVKKSTFSCMPIFNLCGAHRHRPSISNSKG